MKGPRKFSADQVGNLARSLHKRQILGFLQKSGYAIEPDLAPDQFQIRDAAGRAGSLEFPVDGSVKVTTASGLSVSKWFNSGGELRKIAASGGLETVISERSGERIDRKSVG